MILFFALTLFTMLSPVQIRAEVSLKDTLYRKGNEYCVYIDRDCNSANIKKFIDRINIDRYVSTDIQNQIGKMRDNGIRLFHFDLGYLEGTYIRLRTIGGGRMYSVGHHCCGNHILFRQTCYFHHNGNRL